MTRSIAVLLFLASFASSGTLRARQWIVQEPSEQGLREVLAEIAVVREAGDRSHQTVKLLSGVYRLEQPIKLSSALVADGLTISGASTGAVILTSARRPRSSQVVDGRIRYRFESPGSLSPPPRAILIDGRLQSAARHPNVGYNRIETAATDRRSGFRFQPGDLPADLDLDAGHCDLVFLHDWSCSRLPVARIEKGPSQLTTVGPIGCQADHYAIDHFEEHPRYFLEGHPSFADAAGEWFIDRQHGELVMFAGALDESPTVEIPQLEQLIVAGGDGRPVSGLRFENITFTGTTFPMPAGGLAGAQASMHEPRGSDGKRLTPDRPMLSAAVHINHAVECAFTNCHFRGIGNTALWLGSRASESVVDNCTFEDIGGNAINIGENNNRKVGETSWYQSAPEQVPTDNQITRCTIRRCGVMLPGSVAIWAALNKGLEIDHNTIEDCPYTGISLGWIWNDRPSPAGENHIHHNRITRVMQVLSDGGGIYTLGRQPGSQLVSNTIQNVPLNAGRAESNGMFLDEGTSGFTIQDNQFRRITRSPLRFHRASDNTVRANRWELESESTPPVRYNNTPEQNITLEDNRLLARQKRVYLIGNSLTWDTRPPLLDDYVDWHVDCGKSLQFIFDHPADPCVDSSQRWPIALQQLQYDYLCVQPHYGTTLDEDVAVIAKWMAMQPNAIVVIHQGWARSATAAAEYVTASGEEMGHRLSYFTRLASKLTEQFPNRTIRQSSTTEALHQVTEDIQKGTAPIESITNLYRDAIHMTHAEGRYLMHNLMRSAVDQPPSEAGFKIAEQNPELKKYLDRVIRQYATK